MKRYQLVDFCSRYIKTNISGAPDGKLSKLRVAIKDNICVAGVPMMNGSRLMEGFTPEFDATVVTRILEQGKGRQQTVAVYFTMPMWLPHGCHVGCQGFVDN